MAQNIACHPDEVAGFSSPPFRKGEGVSTTSSLSRRRETLHEKRQKAGRIGGITTMLRHGIKHYKKVGSLGGRPRLQNISEIHAKTEDLRANNKTGERLPEQNSLNALKALWRQKIKAGEGCL